METEDIEYEEGLEASIKLPRSSEDAIQSYLNDEAIQHDMYVTDEPNKQRFGKDWYLDLIEDN